jgi:hypothetical protein
MRQKFLVQVTPSDRAVKDIHKATRKQDLPRSESGSVMGTLAMKVNG